MAKKKKTEARPRAIKTAIDYDKLIDEVAKDVGLQIASSLDKTTSIRDAVSTQSLALDLICGGGLPSGSRVNLFGKEQGGKSTLCYQICGALLRRKIHVTFMDYEGSTDQRRVRHLGVKTNWKREARAGKPIYWRYYDDFEHGEQAFRMAKRVLGALPKRDTGLPQMVFVIDSLPAMSPQALVEDDERGSSPLRAAMFSDMLPMIKSRVRAKRALWLDTNQLRINPRQRFGNPEYEPGGSAVKHFSDVRIKATTLNFQDKDKKKIRIEPCADGRGYDRYSFHRFQVVKNKAFSPFRQCNARMWFEHRGAPGFGVDPVYDVFEYLMLTGQIFVAKGNYEIMLPGFEQTVTWKKLKVLVLDGMIRRGLLTGTSYIVQACRKQITDGSAFQMMFDQQSGLIKPGEAEELQKDEEAEDGGSMNLDTGSKPKTKCKKKTTRKKRKKKASKKKAARKKVVKKRTRVKSTAVMVGRHRR